VFLDGAERQELQVRVEERNEKSVRKIMHGGEQMVDARKEWFELEAAGRIARGGWRKEQGGEFKCVTMRVQ
jgi:hypothetical protein